MCYNSTKKIRRQGTTKLYELLNTCKSSVMQQLDETSSPL